MGLGMLLFLVLVVALGPELVPWSPVALDVGPHRQPPTWAHPFGTDEFGRDILSRCLTGGRVSLTVGLVAVALSVSVGTAVGGIGGFLGGWVDRAATALTDLFLALPRLVLLLAIVGVIRVEGTDRLLLLVTVLGATGWMGVARMVRGQVLSLRERDWVAAAVSGGLRPARILWRHILPNTRGPIIVYASLALGSTILTEAALSFLGLGVPPPTPTWGGIIDDGREALRSAPWVSFFPGLFIAAAVTSLNLLGDGLRDAWDPRA
jgi:peptide/nickel transport system permease protein